MKLLRSRRNGMGVIEIIIGAAVIILIGGGIWYALNGNKKNELTPAPTAVAVKKEAKLIWQQTPDGWLASETPPDCPAQPMLKTPTNLSKVTSILYPGQKRGGNYKSHGGFRLDGTSNSSVVVTAPIDGYVVRGAQYIEQGEVQYMFDIMNNCGVMYRLDHLGTLSTKLKDATKTWPPAQVDSSQTQPVTATVYIEAGETLATSVGFVKSKNTSFDFGVYDFRSQNEISKSATYQAAHSQFKETDWHAVCWFDWMSEADEKTIRALPSGDPASGKTSDYCR